MRPITVNDRRDGRPRIDGDRVVWLSHDGVRGDVYTTSVTDTVALNGSVLINGGDTHTRSRHVKLSVSAADVKSSGLQSMRFRNDDGAWSSWEPYDTAKRWVLSETDGRKLVKAQFKDRAGNISKIASDGIILDTKAPAIHLITP